jgi:iron complex outermembrane receptor protein
MVRPLRVAWPALLPGLLLAWAATAAEPPSVDDLRQLSLEQLGDLDVVSVSKRPEPLSQAPAAVYVITNDDIRRSGATTLAEALRLAPNLEVAQINAESYAISARGFNSYGAANKLQVLIDGRTVYSPLHAGVFWDEQQVMLADVDRIEVISGPGGTLWGANAVDGVINVITKSSAETQGGLLDLAAGNQQQRGAGRWGGRMGEHGTYRVYGMGFGIGSTAVHGGGSANDSWHGGQAGFRTDWQHDADRVTVQGDYYRNNIDVDGTMTGGNVLGRWDRQLGNGSSLEVQSFYDRAERNATGLTDQLETYDLQVQNTLTPGARHELVWGGGYRVQRDRFVNRANAFVLTPVSRTIGLGNLFVQDTFAITPALKLTIGTKFEDSSFSGFEYMPNVRLGWAMSDASFLWAAVSRAVRTPSRIDRELNAPGILVESPAFRSEKLIAYELGYRGRPTAATSLSVSVYYNFYDDLRTTQYVSGNTWPAVLTNAMAGQTYGVESWGDWRVVPWWKLSAGVNAMHKALHLKDGAVDVNNRESAGDDPGWQWSVRSSMDFGSGVQFDIGLRAVDELLSPAIPGYLAADARLGWKVNEAVELSLAGFNVFGGLHGESFTSGAPYREVRRSVYLGMRWRF